MSSILISGLINTETTPRIRGFPFSSNYQPVGTWCILKVSIRW